MEYPDKLIILGTAHGQNVDGKRSPDGALLEYKYSREICAALSTILKADGYNVITDFISDTVPKKQQKELSMRCSIVNALCDAWGAENCLYVSIHVNASTTDGWGTAHGWSAYTSKGQTLSDDLATALYYEADELLPHTSKATRTDYSDGDPDIEESFYVLKNTRCPAVLTENLFMDNHKEVDYLLSDEGRATIVEIHRRAIVSFLHAHDPRYINRYDTTPSNE